MKKKKVDADELTQAMKADEAEYLRFRQFLKGQVPVKPTLQDDWTWERNLGQPELTQGQAILAAKKLFAGLETGAPKYFNPFKIRSIEVTKEDDGWKALISFSGDFRKEGGKIISPVETDLTNDGFKKVEIPSMTPKSFKITREVTAKELKDAVRQVALQLKEIGSRIFKSIRNVDVTSSEQEGDSWFVTLSFEGDLQVDPDSPLLSDNGIDWES